MRRFTRELLLDLESCRRDLSAATPEQLKIFARRLASIEMRLQAARSLLEARLFDAEADWEEITPASEELE